MSDESRGGEEPKSKQAGSPRHVLVVDDDPTNLKLVMELLTFAGYHADGALDGASGWEALRAGHYDLLITDNMMPKVTGLELVNLLRGQDTALPVIMATGVIPREEIKRNPRLAINAFLVKPFTADQMLGAVNKVLEEKNPPVESDKAAVASS